MVGDRFTFPPDASHGLPVAAVRATYHGVPAGWLGLH